MKVFKYYRLSIVFLIILFICFGVYVYSNQYMPDEYNMILDQEKSLSYHMPLELDVSGELTGALFVDEKPVSKNNIQIKLNEDISVKSSKKGSYKGRIKLFGILPLKSIRINVLEENDYIPCGQTVGIVVNTDGVLVLGTGNIVTVDGRKYSPAHNKLLSGDYIKGINGKELEDINQLTEEIDHCNGEMIQIQFERNHEVMETEILPVKTTQKGGYKIGLWIRDDTKGIGTMSYINATTKEFGALGHAINDLDTKTVLNIKSGHIVEATVTNINKGVKGDPGEISGVVEDEVSKCYGEIINNNENGIYGIINEKGERYFTHENVMPIGFKYDVKVGKAYVRTDVNGQMNDYEIYIEKLNLNNSSNKGMLIKVIDKKLIEKTNGIVQGMSGCPIIQDNKLIGVITHVFVQDSTKGYGAFIENMILSSDKEY